VAEAVVDALEVVDVYRDRGSARRREPGRDMVEAPTVPGARERIAQRRVAQLPLDMLDRDREQAKVQHAEQHLVRKHRQQRHPLCARKREDRDDDG
jgi:hypothetical protein